MSENAPMIDWSAPITMDDAARLVATTTARLRQLVAAGYVDRVGRGKTTAASAARGVAKFWEDKSKEQTKGSADARVRDARAAEIELRIAERRRDLVPADEALAAIDHILAACAEAFSAIPAMITRDIPERTRIEGIVRKAQGEVAKRLGEAAKLLEEGGKLPDAE